MTGVWGPPDDDAATEHHGSFPRPHVYRSTACLHTRHAMCRYMCKWCPAQCDCPCHRTPFPVKSE